MSDACYQTPLTAFSEALDAILASAHHADYIEQCPLAEASGRVLAENLTARLPVPGFDNSAMDGFALRAEDVTPGTALPISQRIFAGTWPETLTPGSVARIFTGAPMPPGADTVIVQEQADYDDHEAVFSAVPTLNQNVRCRGGDLQEGAPLYASGFRLDARHLASLAAQGMAEVPVHPKLTVALFSTGDELVEPGQPLQPGQLYNSNRIALHALLSGLNVNVLALPTVVDKATAVREAMRNAASNADVIISTGGASVGEADFIHETVSELGELKLWKLRIKPGKPVAFGRIGNADFIGLPGNPVSALVTFCLLARPFILRRMGMTQPLWSAQRRAINVPQPARARREFVRVCLTNDGDLEPFRNQRSDMLHSLSLSDGLAELPENTELAAGDLVSFYPWSAILPVN